MPGEKECWRGGAMETCRPVRRARLRCQESLKDFWWGDVWHQKGRQADLRGSETLVSKEPSSPPGSNAR